MAYLHIAYVRSLVAGEATGASLDGLLVAAVIKSPAFRLLPPVGISSVAHVRRDKIDRGLWLAGVRQEFFHDLLKELEVLAPALNNLGQLVLHLGHVVGVLHLQVVVDPVETLYQDL